MSSTDSIQVKSSSAVFIPINNCDSEYISNLKNYFTRFCNNYNRSVDVKVYYDEYDGYLLVPRFYTDCMLNISYELTQGDIFSVPIESKITLRNDIQRKSVDFLVNNTSGILCLLPGEGKTVVTIDALCKIGKKAIIIVHKDSLINQWINRFKQFTNIQDTQIVRLSSESYRDDLTKDIILTTPQLMCSLFKKTDIRSLLETINFGVVICDECHTSAGAEQFSKVLLYLRSERVFGLSATPNRWDNTDDILRLHLGNIYRPGLSQDIMIPKIIQIYFSFGVCKLRKKYVYGRTAYDYKTKKSPQLDMSRYLKILAAHKDLPFYQVVQKLISKIEGTERHILLLSSRIKILDHVYAFFSNPDDVGFFLPRSGDNRDVELKKKVVLSTYGSCRDGVDKPEWSYLIMLTPCGNWEQAIGRVIRKKEGKETPIVLDLVDIDDTIFIHQAVKRYRNYLAKGWNVVKRTVY